MIETSEAKTDMIDLQFPAIWNFALFLVAGFVVWLSGSRLIRFADVLSDRLSLTKSTIGLIFLASATSLPEMVTTVSGAIEQNADLVLNNLFGGIALQTAMLAVADYWARGSITNYPQRTDHLLEATLLLLMLSGLWVVIISEERLAFWNIGVGAIVLALVYGSAIVLLRRNSGTANWVPIDIPSDLPDPVPPPLASAYDSWSTNALIAAALLACGGVFAAGTALVWLAQAIASQTGLGSSFVGASFLALATSLPELSVTISAVRSGAYTLAISNVFGSNLIMVVLVFPADVLYRGAPILSTADQSAQLGIAAGMIVTIIFMVGMIIRNTPRIGRFGADSILVLLVYGLTLAGLYGLK